jgi:urea carboxylase-associated protein 2
LRLWPALTRGGERRRTTSVTTMSSSETNGGILWRERLPGGAHWSGRLRRGTTLRIVDIEGGANVAAMFYNAEDPLERYNMPDTLKAQHTAYLTTGCVCYSDMGRILCSITADSCGWHDTICGVSNEEMVMDRFGRARYQEHRNDWHRNGQESLLIELGKHGLGARDFGPVINFFSKVATDELGWLKFQPAHSPPGAHVELRFEMNALVVLSACQHPLDGAGAYRPRPVDLIAIDTGPAPQDDPCRLRCPENGRGFVNTERLYA